MKFFTRDWCQGNLTDDEVQAVIFDYQRHLDTCDLPESVRALAHLNPHDAYVLNFEHKPREGTLRLRLRCGDLQRGYFDAVLDFAEAILAPKDAETLVLARYPAAYEILYDEVDRVGSDAFEYRLLLDPTGEVAIRFSRVAIDRRPVADRRAI